MFAVKKILNCEILEAWEPESIMGATELYGSLVP